MKIVIIIIVFARTLLLRTGHFQKSDESAISAELSCATASMQTWEIICSWLKRLEQKLSSGWGLCVRVCACACLCFRWGEVFRRGAITCVPSVLAPRTAEPRCLPVGLSWLVLGAVNFAFWVCMRHSGVGVKGRGVKEGGCRGSGGHLHHQSTSSASPVMLRCFVT